MKFERGEGFEMVRKTDEHTPENSAEREKGITFTVFRHSGPPYYRLDRSIVTSRNPEAKPLANDQSFYSDLPPQARELALRKAQEFFDRRDPKTNKPIMDPKKDAAFFVSSDLNRSVETALIFLEEAHRRGFEIIEPRKEQGERTAYRDMADHVSEGAIRKIECLTLNHLENKLREEIFQPTDFLKEVVKYPENVSQETLEKWGQARAIIERDNRGSWGANYAAHSQEIEKIFPNVKSAESVYNTKFKQMLKLVRFGEKKRQESGFPKNVRVLGFSHENSFIYFLQQNFGETMGYCEDIAFDATPKADTLGGDVSVMAKGKAVRFNKEDEIYP